MLYRLRLRRACVRRAADRHPDAFRAAVRWQPLGKPGANHGVGEVSEACHSKPALTGLTAWQERDFVALDDAWRSLAGHHVNEPVVRRAYLERPRGHSKTTDMAIQCAWILQYSPHAVRGLAAAADQDQAGLLHAAIADLVRRHPDLCPDLIAQQHVIRNRRTQSRLDVISSDVNSSWGQLPDFIICDELCHWPKPDLWHSLCSSAAKKPKCVLAVLTNAGIGAGWQWNVREAARTSRRWYFSSLAGSQAPWISTASLDEQRRLLPPAVYARLWDNAWQHSDGEFVSLAEAEACRDEQRVAQTRGALNRTYVAAIDYAEKHDRTAAVIVHREGDVMVVDRMDVAVPQPGAPVLVQWVEDWMTQTAAAFPSIRFVLDEYQLLSVIQRHSGQHVVNRFDFAGGRGNHALTMTLRNLIVHRRVQWYPGCGQLSTTAERDDLETELAALVLRQLSGGRVRIDHRRESGAHDDRAFALGLACLEALRTDFGEESLRITPPLRDGDFAW